MAGFDQIRVSLDIQDSNGVLIHTLCTDRIIDIPYEKMYSNTEWYSFVENTLKSLLIEYEVVEDLSFQYHLKLDTLGRYMSEDRVYIKRQYIRLESKIPIEINFWDY